MAEPKHATAHVEELLGFWFQAVGDDGVPSPRAAQLWFAGGAEFDGEIRTRFGADVDAALRGELDSWADMPRARLALVILLDQFPRNLHRGSARAFAGDSQALALAAACVDSRDDIELRPIERYFLYLPFEHSEQLAMQRRACALYEALLHDAPHGAEATFEAAIDWAQRHAAVIERFGRFPSRNAALGRSSTSEELAFLAETPIGF